MADVLTEYLVSLGFTTDEPSFNKLKNIMSDSERLVTQYAGGMAKSIIGAQTAIVGGFLSVSAAIVGVVDKVAMADQAWRLMGLRMMTTTETARKMDMIQKALGVSLQEIVWDRSGELQKRAQDLGDQIDRLNKMLGPGFAQDMRGVRDLRFEFSKMGIDLEYLTMKFSSDLFRKMGGEGDIFSWLSKKELEFEAGLPSLADKLSTYAIPILKDTWEIAKDLGEVLKDAGLAFTNVVGLFSGDKSILGSQLDFDKLALAIGHVTSTLRIMVESIDLAEKLLGHFASGVALLLSKDYAGAKKEFQSGFSDIGEFRKKEEAEKAQQEQQARFRIFMASPTLIQRDEELPISGTPKAFQFWRQEYQQSFDTGAFPATDMSKLTTLPKAKLPSSLAPTVPFDRAIGDWITSHVTQLDDWLYSLEHPEDKYVPPPLGKKTSIGGSGNHLGTWPPPKGGAGANQPVVSMDIQDLIRAAAVSTSAEQYPVPEAMALAVAKHESGFNPNAKNFNRDKAGNITSTDWGVMQLNDQTLKTFKMSSVDALDAGKNIDVGVRLLSQLMKHYEGDQVKALAAYSAGQGRVDKAAGLASLPEVTRKAVPEILQIEKQFMTTEEKATAPSWYALTPEFMRTSPVWYGVAPAWMTKHPEGDSGKIGTAWADTNISNEFKAKMDSAQRPIVADSGSANVTHTTTVTFGNIVITQPGATAHQIQRAVDEGVREALNSQVRNDLTQTSPLY